MSPPIQRRARLVTASLAVGIAALLAMLVAARVINDSPGLQVGVAYVPRGRSVDNLVADGDVRVDGVVRGSVTSRHGDVAVRGRVGHDVRAPAGRVVLGARARVVGDVVSRGAPRAAKTEVVGGKVRRVPSRPGRGGSGAPDVIAIATLLAVFVLGAYAVRRRRALARAGPARPRVRRPRLIRRRDLGPVALRLGAMVLASGATLAVFTAALVPGMHTIATSGRFKGKLPPLRQLSQPTTVYAADGSQIGVLGDVDRDPVPLAQVPKVLVNAVIATEDRTFYSNSGVDPGGLMRAFVQNVTSGKIEQGGSTISQQLVKNRILRPRRNVRRKIQEIALAYRLNERYSKDEILQEYLNTVYFGQGAYGVKTAAGRFFLKPLEQLDLGESALLAGQIADPEGSNPFTNPTRAKARRDEVLHDMVDQHKITRAQAAFAGQEPLPTVAPPPTDYRPDNYFVEEVQRRLLADPRLGATEQQRRDQLLRGGLRVETTLDPAAQVRAQSAVDGNLPGPGPFTGALVAVDPSSGAVRAMVGGPGFSASQYNIATHQPGRQVGSTWKVITLAAALEAGYSPNDTVDGTSPCTVSAPGTGTYTTENAEPGGGDLPLRTATEESVNCAFVRLITSLGPARAVDMAHRLGIVQDVPPYLSITLGTRETTPLEMSTVASTLAANGVRHDPVFVARVTGPDGHVVLDDSNRPGQPVISPDVASCETDMLRGVITNGTGTAAQLDSHTGAGKTGTTDDKTDAWFLGYTPQLATVVWYGASTGRVPGAGFGGEIPARIWKGFMDAQLTDQPDAPFAPPSALCDAPGQMITPAGREGDAQPAPPPAPAPGPAAPPPAPAPPPGGKHGKKG